IRIRVDLFSNEAVALKDIGAEIYINNRFFIAMTLIHELMHTWFGMDDFHYADIIGHLNCDKKEGVYYSGLVLGEQSAKDTLKALQDDDYYPKGTQFNLDQYTWQINNVDNYVLAITKIYFLDEVMCKHQSKNGYPNALKDKKALAKTRLAYLAAYNVHNKPGTIKMNRLLEAEKDCWARESGDYNDLMTTMVASNSHVDRFSQ
ncbi:MAG: hypothetical protein MJK04_08765, partial [Psychrosphaera sp.]|nr:hypothetical protein [Psychrosphaera sp.]